MPELPEVETVTRQIRPRLEGRRITSVRVGWLRSLGGVSRATFGRRVRGASIVRVRRRGKYIVLQLERRGRPAGALLVHLRMTGRLQVDAAATPPGKHARVSLGLAGAETLRFLDARKFGRFMFVADAASVLDLLGPEPLGSEFTPAGFFDALKERRRMLKPLLLDQRFLAGLGNIYVDESLFRSRLHPERRAHTLSRRASLELYDAIRQVLTEAVAREGSSFDAAYRTPAGRPGSYQAQFQVYGRQGRPCFRCGARIRRLVVGQRGTHVCPRCQR